MANIFKVFTSCVTDGQPRPRGLQIFTQRICPAEAWGWVGGWREQWQGGQLAGHSGGKWGESRPEHEQRRHLRAPGQTRVQAAVTCVCLFLCTLGLICDAHLGCRLLACGNSSVMANGSRCQEIFHNQMLTFVECCDWLRPMLRPWMTSFIPCNNRVKYLPFLPFFYRWGNRGSERLSDLPKVTQPGFKSKSDCTAFSHHTYCLVIDWYTGTSYSIFGFSCFSLT